MFSLHDRSDAHCLDFERVETPDFPKENYLMRFRKK